MVQTRSQLAQMNKKVKVTKKDVISDDEEVKQEQILKPKFIFNGFDSKTRVGVKGKVKYGTKNEMYYTYIKTENAKYKDVVNFVQKLMPDFRQANPNTMVNIQIKYKNMSHAVSGGFFNVNDDVKIVQSYSGFEDDEVDTVFFSWVE